MGEGTGVGVNVSVAVGIGVSAAVGGGEGVAGAVGVAVAVGVTVAVLVAMVVDITAVVGVDVDAGVVLAIGALVGEVVPVPVALGDAVSVTCANAAKVNTGSGVLSAVEQLASSQNAPRDNVNKTRRVKTRIRTGVHLVSVEHFIDGSLMQFGEGVKQAGMSRSSGALVGRGNQPGASLVSWHRSGQRV